VAFVGIRLEERVHGLKPNDAQRVADQLQHRLTVPEEIAELADQLCVHSQRNPDVGETRQDIVPAEGQKRALLEAMNALRPESDDDGDGWDALVAALRSEVEKE
jgi:hypothetical protein